MCLVLHSLQSYQPSRVGEWDLALNQGAIAFMAFALAYATSHGQLRLRTNREWHSNLEIKFPDGLCFLPTDFVFFDHEGLPGRLALRRGADFVDG